MPSEVVGESNGHVWIKADWIKYVCCRKCGIIRRADDKNKQCPGVVGISLREQTK